VAAFQAAAQQQALMFEARAHDELSLIVSVTGLYAASRHVERAEFNVFVDQAVARTPSLLTMIWAPRVPHAQRTAFERAALAEGLPGFTLHDAEGRPVPRRAAYFPVFYGRPAPPPSLGWGLDLDSNPDFAEAIRNSVRTGTVAASRPFPLPGQGQAILALAPLHAGQPAPGAAALPGGVVAGLFDVSQLLDRVVGGPGRRVDLRIDDVTGPEPPRLVATTAGEDAVESGLQLVHAFQFADREWRATCTPAAGYFTARAGWVSRTGLGLALAMTGLLGLHLAGGARREALVGQLVARRTVDLRQATARLQQETSERRQLEMERDQFFSVSVDMLCIADFDGYFKQINSAWSRTLGHNMDDLLARPYIDFVHPDDRESTRDAADQLLQGHKLIEFSNRFRCRDGSYLWLRWNAISDVPRRLIYAVARDFTERKQYEDRIHRDNRLLQSIDRIQSYFIAASQPEVVFENMLTDLLDLSGSEYGFIAEVHHDAGGKPFLKSKAISDIAWDKATRELYDRAAPGGLEFHNLDTLFGAVLRTREPVIANDARTDPRRGGLPPGHPPLLAFLGAPLLSGDRIVGVAGLANRAGGYDAALLAYLQPLLATCGHLIEEYRNESKRKATESSLRDSEMRMGAVLGSIFDGIITINEQGLIESVNPAAERIFGYPAVELVGSNVARLMPDPHRSRHDSYLRGYLDSGHARIIGRVREVEGLRKDGTLFPLEIAVNEIRLGGRRVFSGTLRDVTERKAMERMKTEFISTVSHELRTPLTSIRGSLGLLSAGVGGELSERANSLVEMANANSERLVRLITDILDIEKIESGETGLRLQPVDLGALVEQAVAQNQDYATQFGVTLRIVQPRAGLRVRADPDKLHQVLANLLGNAAKFSPPGAVVEIDLSRAGEHARVAVHDSGPGVPEEFRPRIFQKFAQADGSDMRRPGGTGLGLSIAKAIVERHGGRVGFDSPPGGGATFYFELPVAAAGTRPRVLVCEDDRDVARLLTLLLERDGFAVDIAHDPAQARELLAAHAFDAMTLEVRLADSDGLALLHALRADPRTESLPVVVVSGRDVAAQGAQGLRIFDWLRKPIDEDSLVAAVRGATRTGARRPRLLHVEDDATISRMVASVLAPHADVRVAPSLEVARRHLAEGEFDLFILDIAMPDGSGLDLLPELSARAPHVPVVIFAADEVPAADAGRVAAALVKSRASGRELVKTIRRLVQV